MGTAPNTAKSYHLLSNFVITVNGDTATAWSRWGFVVPGERGAAISRPAATTTRWFARRPLAVQAPCRLQRHARTGSRRPRRCASGRGPLTAA